jgi:Nucleotidyl transferase AbiEii toxin, Type IV TA system
VIPADFIAEWRRHVRWVPTSQVEQDLVLSRVLVEIFGDPDLARALAFRGGTALFKLHLTPAPRYSEDIDLVQTRGEPIGATLDRLRARLGPWLGAPKRTLNQGRVTLLYRFASEDVEPLPLRLKVEINSREHFSVLGLEQRPFEMRSPWFSGTASGHRQVDLSGKRVGEIMEREGRLMGEHPGLFGPQPENDEVLVLAGREVHDAVDTTSHAHHLPRRQVLVKERARIARLGGLSRREVAALGLRDDEETIPIRLVRCLRSYSDHDARMFTHG